MPFQYQGPSSSEVTRTIAGALQQKQQTDRQADIDALQYGIGATPYNAGDPENAPGLSFGERIKQGLSRVTGHGDPYATRNADWNMANHPPTVGITDNGQGGGTTPTVAPSSDNPGAFSALTGGFTPAGVPAKLRLPSGKIVDTMMTPFGRQMMQAQETRNFQQMMLQERGNQTMQQIGARGDIQSGIADKRIGATLAVAAGHDATSTANSVRSSQTSQRNHDTPSGSTIYSVQNRQPPQGAFTPIVTTDPTSGAQHVSRFNRQNGTIEDTGAAAKAGATGSGGGQSAFRDAQLRVAKQQALAADQIMTDFENEVLSGKAHLSAMSLAAAKRALAPGAIGSTLSEAALNAMDPRLAGYVRAAHQMATAERLITPRGGSNSLMQAEATLSAAGAGANPALIKQARGYRSAVVGGLTAHDGAGSSPPPPASNGGQRPTLTPAQQTRAQHDPEYAAFLRSKGLM